MAMIRKYVCPKCKSALSYVRYDDESANASGITVFCKKCGSVVPLEIKNVKNLQKSLDK